MFWLQRNVLQTKQLFLRYLLSYMLVLAIPLSIIVLLVYNYFFHLLQEEVIKNNDNILQHVVTSLDHQISGMNTVAYQIYNNPDLTTQQIGDGPYNTSKGIRQLKSYISGNNFISDVVVYYKQLNKFVSSTRTYTLKEFLAVYYGGAVSEDQFLTAVRDIDGNGVWVPDDTGGGELGRVVSYLIPNSSNYDKRMVLFIIKQHAFEQMMSSNKGNVVAINPERKIVAASKEIKRPQVQDLMAFIQPDRIEHSVITNISSSPHFVSYIQSPETGWSYFMIMPVKEAMSQVYAAKNAFLEALLVIVLAGGTAILFNMRLNYRPIRQLRLFAESETGSIAETGNEFEAVRMTINRINHTNKILKDQVKSNHSAVKDYLLTHLLSGVFPNAEAFNEKGSDFGLSFSLPFFRVVIFSAAALEPQQRERASMLSTLLEQALPDGIEGYGRINIDNRLILILASGRESDRKTLHDALTHMQQLLMNELHSQVAVGVGNPYDAAGQIGKSCLEAYTALDYRLVKGADQIIYFEDIRIAAVSDFPYPVEELRALELSIIEGNTDRISFIVAELVDKITQCDIPLFEARCLCFDIINTVLKAMQQINKKFVGLDKGNIDVLSLAQFETVKELGQSITDVCQTLCKYIKDTREKHDDELLQQWVAYIETNYHDTNFTVQNMADHFNMSLSNLSYYFKKCFGQSISDYINYLRIEKAKQLLSSTEKPLIEIISEIGYCDVSSFVRKFKKEVGTTPGGFRKYKSI
ncbi:helix-turn-helix domain-containing protein [Paenibacillus sp. KQZ6P-2]|uniref:Helix-turn-helix domain-containing protein n=1 Tax=Paenibacillus mangrovi TaxID=2931978 RepID=A0A9X1WME7_9BACL|nr:helix-turn-helix domain-containing protein [Paenibacillus mangrovi]MCJ8011574.1 helix-turn-helix domain-containing protein [Paenibacillus mangrovi]